MRPDARFVLIVPPLNMAVIMLVVGWLTPWTTARTVGLVLTVVGLVLLTAARIQLGNSFSYGAQASRLVTTGLYRWLRHPVYLFSGIAIGGCFLFLWPWLLLLLLIIVPMQVARARAESRVLEATFGDAYRAYRRQTWL